MANVRARDVSIVRSKGAETISPGTVLSTFCASIRNAHLSLSGNNLGYMGSVERSGVYLSVVRSLVIIAVPTRNVALSIAVEGSRSGVAKSREDPRAIGKENGTRTVDILEAGVSSGLTNRGRDAYEIATLCPLRSLAPPRSCFTLSHSRSSCHTFRLSTKEKSSLASSTSLSSAANYGAPSL